MLNKFYKKITPTIDCLLKESKNLIIAIDGNCGSGKSSLASYLADEYDCNVLHMDNFFLRPEQRTKERLSEIGGNIDYVRFKREALDKLKQNKEFEYQIYDCFVGKLTDYIKVIPKKLNIVEGVYSLHPTLIDAYDLKIFMEISKETQEKRILKRSGKSMLQRFIEEWIPLENEYFAKMNIAEKSDIILRTD